LNIDDSKERQKRFKKERKTYGFDSRETWAMDYTLATWLYEHLSWYRDNAPIDMTMYKFQVPAWNKKKKRPCKKKTMTLDQGQCIDTIIENLKFYIKNESAPGPKVRVEAQERLQYALHLLAEIIGTLWW
jgi:hypothetical protein